MVLGFWWLLQSCLCLYVQIRFFIRGFFSFFFLFFGFLIWVCGGFFWLSDLDFWLLVVGGCFLNGWWGLVAGCVLVAVFFFPMRSFGWWWFVQLCLLLVGFENYEKKIRFTMKQTLENDFHCIFKYEVKHNKMKMF